MNKILSPKGVLLILTLTLTSCSTNLGQWHKPKGFKPYKGRNYGSFSGPETKTKCFSILDTEYEANANVVWEVSRSGKQGASFYEIRVDKKVGEEHFHSDLLKIPLDYLDEDILKKSTEEVVVVNKEKRVVIFNLGDKVFKMILK